MRSHKSIFVVALFSLLNFSSATAVEIPPSFNFQGSGYGHGVGMSQIGARAMALSGESATSIVMYYYKDVNVEPVADNQNLRINLGHQLSTVKVFSSTTGARLQLFSGDLGERMDATPISTFPNKATLTFSINGTMVSPTSTLGKNTTLLPQNRIFTLRWSGTRYLEGIESILSMTHSGSTKRYKYGELQFKAIKVAGIGYRIEVTNTLRLHDEYLWGIGEMPSSWPAAALEAQVIASRTYALSKAGKLRTVCDCDLYGVMKDQTFLGYAKEIEPRYGARWKAAVAATTIDESSGLTLTYLGQPISAYFFSSSAGQTETARNAWGTDRAYSVSVSDIASTDLTLNPRYVSWNREVTQSLVAAAFCLPDVLSLEILTKNTTGTVAQIRATSSSGLQVTLKGETFRSRSKIPSPWFELVSVQN